MIMKTTLFKSFIQRKGSFYDFIILEPSKQLSNQSKPIIILAHVIINHEISTI